MDGEDLYPQVAYFVRDAWGEPRAGLLPSTRLVADLGMAGDDGDEFMAAYAAEFGVDLSGFPSLAVFGHEGVWPWEPPLAAVTLPVQGARWMLRRLLGRMGLGSRGQQPDVTLENLAKWAARGRWAANET